MSETAQQIAADVRAGRISARDVVRTALGRIAERDDAVAAFVSVSAERALADADALAARPDLADLPLAGVPVAVKDAVPVAGAVMREGSAALPAVAATDDHPVVARLRAAGAVVVGITAVPELCVFGTTDVPGRITRNPWNHDATAGGSSGGAAAAVAAGMVPIAHAADGMGSIRGPAACCGLVGIKPGLGVVPSELGVNSWGGLSENGPLATTVGDAALMLSVMAGDPTLATVTDPGRLRIGVDITSPVRVTRVDRQFRDATRDVGRVLAAAGHQVSTVRVPYPQNPIVQLGRWFAGVADESEGLDAALLQPRTRRHAAIGRAVSRAGLIRPAQIDRLRRRALEVFDSIDVVVTPTLARPPIGAVPWSERSWLANISANVRYVPFPAMWNLLGWPALSVPAGVHTGSGTPLAVQCAGPPGSEATLVAVAAQIERDRPWLRIPPKYLQPTGGCGNTNARSVR